MPLRNLKKIFTARLLWGKVTTTQIAAFLIAAFIITIVGYVWLFLKSKAETTAAPNVVVNETVNINVINYADGLPQAENPEVRTLFDDATEHYKNQEFGAAIQEFARCLELTEDSEKRGALNLQIGNCYYQRKIYPKAAEFYEAGLRESRKAKDLQGESSNLVGIANTYMLRPASSEKARGDNTRKAVEKYVIALKIFNRDEYPVYYATTENNLGAAYMNLPAVTPEERAKNVRAAIDCFRAAMEIFNKDEYPVEYARTQNNVGNAYMALPSAMSEERTQNVRAAIECYRAALEIPKKDEYAIDYASTQNNLGLAYIALPVATSEEQTQIVMAAIDRHKAALEIYKKDKYPNDYAKTVSNLGNAYKILPTITSEERAKNIRDAIDCYKAALEIWKKDKYPQYYCRTAENLGSTMALINNPDACYWLKEAYALREYLEDHGRRLEYHIRRICEKE